MTDTHLHDGGRPVDVFEAQARALIAGLTELRRRIISGEMDGDLAAIDRRVTLDSRHPDSVCPACGYRPVQVPRSGFCELCHLHALVQQADWSLTVAESRRQLDAYRKRVQRAKDSVPASPETADTGGTMEA